MCIIKLLLLLLLPPPHYPPVHNKRRERGPFRAQWETRKGKMLLSDCDPLRLFEPPFYTFYHFGEEPNSSSIVHESVSHGT